MTPDKELAVADVVVGVSNVAVFAVLDRAGHGLGLQPAEVVVGIPSRPFIELFARSIQPRRALPDVQDLSTCSF